MASHTSHSRVSKSDVPSAHNAAPCEILACDAGFLSLCRKGASAIELCDYVEVSCIFGGRRPGVTLVKKARALAIESAPDSFPTPRPGPRPRPSSSPTLPSDPFAPTSWRAPNRSSSKPSPAPTLGNSSMQTGSGQEEGSWLGVPLPPPLRPSAEQQELWRQLQNDWSVDGLGASPSGTSPVQCSSSKRQTSNGRTSQMNKSNEVKGSAPDIFAVSPASYETPCPTIFPLPAPEDDVRMLPKKTVPKKAPGKKALPEVEALPTQPRLQGCELEGGGLMMSVTDTRIRSLDELFSFHQLKREEWDVIRVKPNFWEVTMKGNDGAPITVQNHQLSAWLSPRRDVLQLKAVWQAMVEEARAHAPRYPQIIYPRVTGGHLLELCLPDVHFGKLAHAEECGDHYDFAEAERLYRAAVEDILAKSGAYPIERICFPIGNDLLNVDNWSSTTTAGTPQQGDARYQRTYRRLWKLLVDIIERLAVIAPVDVLSVPGNHDRESTFTLTEILGAWFANSSSVSVNNEPTLRKYYPFGNTLLLFTHGSEEKRVDLPLLMATENRAMWSNAKFCEIHTGHLHFTKVDEKMGVRVRILPSLCASDAWHTQKGYTGNIRSAEAFLWSFDRGLAGTAVYNVM